MPWNSRINSLPETAGQLIDALFPGSKELTQDSNRTRLYEYMTAHASENRWIRKDNGLVAYQAFSKRLSKTVLDNISFAEGADLSHPLISFFWYAAAQTASNTERDILEDKARYVQRSFIDGLSKQLSPKDLAIVPLENSLLKLVDTPWDYSMSDLKRWRVLCLNGDTELYRNSLTLFWLKHMLTLNIQESRLKLLGLAVVMARICITYADYNAARIICSTLRRGCESLSNFKRAKIVLQADRVFADATAYLAFEKDRSDVDLVFSEALARFEEITKSAKNEDAWKVFAMKRDLLSVQVRSVARLRLLDSETKTIVAKIPKYSDEKLLQELHDSIEYFARGPFKNDLDIGLRFVHYDSLARGKAMLIPTETGLNEAKAIIAKVEHTIFAEDLEEHEILDELNHPEYKDVHKSYRLLITKAMIDCQEAAQFPINSNNRTHSLSSARNHLRNVVKLITISNMFHSRAEVELIRARIMQIESEA